MASAHLATPYLSAGLAEINDGVGGMIRRRQDDFVVEEAPLYEPDGSGEHAYLWIEKRGITTRQALHRLCRAFGAEPRAAAAAGMKDAQALARQWVSIHGIDPRRAEGHDDGSLRVLKATRHRNKLRLGHLRGNSFMIRVRGVSPDRAPLVASIIEVLRRRGVPNLFGPQRFGYFGNNHLVGRALLKGRWEEVWSSLLTSTRSEDRQLEAARQALSDGGVEAALRELGGAYNEEQKLLQVLRRNRGNPRRGARALPREAAWRYLTAYQSLLFNRCTARRMPEIDALRSGDIALKHSNKAAFLVERPDEETARLAGFAISPAGPMFGSKLLAASGAVAEMEHRVLAEEELSLDDFAAVLCGVRLTGERRPYRVPVAQWQHEWEPSEQAGESILRLSFFLPAGSFATAVLRELMRTPDLEPPS